MAPLHIKTLSIQNFRAIDRLDLAFECDREEGGLAVLAGDNGCGKTSVLEAILMLSGQRHLTRLEPAGQYIRFGARDMSIRVELTDGSAALYDEAIQPKKSIFAQELKVDFVYFPARREESSHRPQELKRRLINVYNRSIRGGGLGPESPFSRLQAALRPFLGREWVMDVLFESEKSDAEPGVVFRDFELPPGVTSIEQARKLAREKLLGKVLSLEQLSSGQLALFSLLGPLVFRAPEEHPLVLIDEPEQHMHPIWQRELMPALRLLSPQSQFIVATHSLDILHSAMSYERHLLLKGDDPRAQGWQPPRREAGE